MMIQQLYDFISISSKEESSSPTPKIKVTKATSALAYLYEKIRVAMEYKDESLLRRTAIERIIKRRISLTFSEKDGKDIAEPLLKELIRARYLPNDAIPQGKVEEVALVLDSYITFLHRFPSEWEKKYFNWIVGVCSWALEKTINPLQTEKSEFYTKFVVERFLPQIQIELSPEQKEILTYLSVARILYKYDEPIQRYYLAKRFVANWDDKNLPNLTNFPELSAKIDGFIFAPQTSEISRYVRKYIGPFLVLEKLIQENEQGSVRILENPTALELSIHKISERYFTTLEQRLRIKSTRAIIYIFLTKVLFALAVEVPYDLWVGRVGYLPIAINLIFPPALLYLLTSRIDIPVEENSQKISEIVSSLVYRGGMDKSVGVFPYEGKLKARRFSIFFYWFLYLLAFVISFGLVLKILTTLDFSPLAILVFIFFTSLVALFGYAIRRGAREISLVEEREGYLTPLIDFIMYPLLRVGTWLSKGIAKLNFLTFFFDFIIEAPFQTVLEVFDEWVAYIREKREEII